MKTLSNLDFLTVWERGSHLHPLDRALLLLASALPDESSNGLAEWPLGRRNGALARLRRAHFGKKLEGWVACPCCTERLEFALDTEAIAGEGGTPEMRIAVGERTFRLPNSRDLAGVAHENDTDEAAWRVLRACCADEADLAGADIDAIGERIAEADPLAETRVSLRCPECGNQWDEPLDIAAWLWEETEARSRRLLLDVHTLALAYGWSEGEILSLSEARRALYLEMVQA
jgi:hypothetical protein